MENKPKWQPGDTCVMIASVSRRYALEYTVQSFDGEYYTVTRGKYMHRAKPERLFKTKEDALASLDVKPEIDENNAICVEETIEDIVNDNTDMSQTI